MRWLSALVMRPVATTLLALTLVFTGMLAYRLLPVSPLPDVAFPIISVSASLPGASPETMASSVAMPLEQSLGAIAGVTDMSSSSTEGVTRITLQFDLNRNINGAARDVQAAINAARSQLPSGLRTLPTYRKVNPASAPILVLALTSDTVGRGALYDLASTVLAQKLSQMPGVGEVNVGGSSLPAVRVHLNPQALVSAGVALDDVREALSGANTLRPNGMVEDDRHHWVLSSGGQLSRAVQYRPLIVAWRNGAPVRLGDVATVGDSVEDIYQTGFFNGRTAVLLIVRRQSDANIIATVDRIRAELPALEALMPADVSLTVAQDRTPSIRASLGEAELTLAIAVLLVVLVVMMFLRDARAALIPSVAVPVSLIATFGLLLSFGYTLNTISLMALIVASGFVVDDAIVVLENIVRHMERGLSPVRAALRGLREVGFTVVAMSLSLVAVFIPILLMGGIVGRLFREFAVTLSVAVGISLVVSLTLTPMMCAHLPWRGARGEKGVGRLGRLLAGAGAAFGNGYQRSLDWALAHGRFMLLLLAATIGLNFYLYTVVPKGFFPQQDTGQLLGFFRVDQGTSFTAMVPRLSGFIDSIREDRAVQSVTGFAGGRGGGDSSFLLIQLKPFAQRDVTADEVVARLRHKFQGVPGTRLTLVPQQDIRVGGHATSTAAYDYTLMASDLTLLRQWVPRVRRALAGLPELADVDTSAQDGGSRVSLVVDRDAASRLGVDMALVSSTLNDSFSQRQVSVIYGALNQYHVVMGIDPSQSRDTRALERVQVVTAAGHRVPLSAFTRFEAGNAPLSVRHQGLFAADAISFSLAPGVSLARATQAIDEAVARIGLPAREIQAGYSGEAGQLQRVLAQQPWLILAALVAMYIVLGVLYESYVHPVTILSTLPSAGIGALLALILLGQEFTLIALIGVFLLIGIVKKNAIMMVDFARLARRRHGLSAREAIREACLARFRPIMMTTVSAVFGALPLVFAAGAGVELRRPLGLTIVGGLIVSQMLTLYTTPVVYLYLDRLGEWIDRRRGSMRVG